MYGPYSTPVKRKRGEFAFGSRTNPDAALVGTLPKSHDLCRPLPGTGVNECKRLIASVEFRITRNALQLLVEDFLFTVTRTAKLGEPR